MFWFISGDSPRIVGREKFTNTALKSLRGSAGYAKLKPVAEDMISKMYEGYPDAKAFSDEKDFRAASQDHRRKR